MALRLFQSSSRRSFMSNVRLYVDFWNFQLSWNAEISPDPSNRIKISWRNMSQVLIGELGAVIGADSYQYRGTEVFASVHPDSDHGLKGFLHWLNQNTGYQVHRRDRKAKQDECPHCKKTIQRMVEKGVDASIVTALYEGAINNSYDIAMLLSNDGDHIPAIRTIQDRLNKRIVHVGFKTGGNAVRSATWSHVTLDGDLADRLSDQ